MIVNEELRQNLLSVLKDSGVDTSGVIFSTGNIQIKCPFASVGGHAKSYDSKPSLGILVGGTFQWNCFTCGRRGGDIFSFYDQLWQHKLVSIPSKELYKLYSEIMLDFPDWSDRGNKQKKDIAEDSTNFQIPAKFIANKPDFLYEYNRYKRRIPRNLVDRMRMCCDDKNNILMPVYSKKGFYNGYVRRDTNGGDPKYMNYLENRTIFYLEWLISTTTGIIVEGPYDALVTFKYLEKAGLLEKYSVIATLGSEISDAQFARLPKFFTKLIIYSDNDPAGKKMGRAIKKQLHSKIPVISRIEYETHDPADNGYAEFIAQLQNNLSFVF